MKKCFATLSAIIFSLLMLVDTPAAADKIEAETGQIGSAVVIEAQSGQRIFERNADERLDVGGLVRLPALLYAAECMDKGIISRDDIITVSPQAANVGGATAFLKAGESIKAETAMKAAVMITAGDAVFALAEECAGGQNEAVKEINVLLQELGIFNEISSIDGGGLLLSAQELAKIGARLAESAVYKEFSSVYYDNIIHENGSTTELVNQNKLIKNMEGCFAGSTGSSAAAKYCGVFMVNREGALFVAAVIGAQSADVRSSCAKNIIEASNAAVKIKFPIKKGEVVVNSVEVSGGIKKTVDLVAADDVALLIWNGDAEKRIINAQEAYSAPITAGQKAGTIEFIFEISGSSVQTDLLFNADIKAAGFMDFVKLCSVKWVHGA